MSLASHVRYVAEPDSTRANDLLATDQRAGHGAPRGGRGAQELARLLPPTGVAKARAAFADDLGAFAIVEIDAVTCELAATIAEQTGVRTVDGLHLGAARRLGTALTFVTFDVRQAQAARTIGFAVAGA